MVTVNLCLLHRQPSLMASQDLHLLTWRKSLTNMNTMMCFPTRSHVHSSLLRFFFPSTEEGTHSPQSGYVQLSPMTAPRLLSDLSTSPPVLDSHKPPHHHQPSRFISEVVQLCLAFTVRVKWHKILAGTEEDDAIWIWGPLTAANSHTEVFWDQGIFKVMYFLCLFLSFCVWWWYLTDHIVTCTWEID